jgi:predicted nucleic acid-binding protein
VNLFLDSSVLLAACGSTRGASRALFSHARPNDWTLLASPYVLSEVAVNLGHFPPAAATDWLQLRRQLALVDDIVCLDRIHLFPASKDRPILFTALAWGSVLLTLDEADFAKLLGREFYGLEILRPADFFTRQRAAGRLQPA